MNKIPRPIRHLDFDPEIEMGIDPNTERRVAQEWLAEQLEDYSVNFIEVAKDLDANFETQYTEFNPLRYAINSAISRPNIIKGLVLYSKTTIDHSGRKFTRLIITDSSELKTLSYSVDHNDKRQGRVHVTEGIGEVDAREAMSILSSATNAMDGFILAH